MPVERCAGIVEEAVQVSGVGARSRSSKSRDLPAMLIPSDYCTRGRGGFTSSNRGEMNDDISRDVPQMLTDYAALLCKLKIYSPDGLP